VTIRVGAQKDALANAYAAAAPHLAGFTADPGATGAATNELTGGSPAYARKALGWTTASGGTGQVSGSATLDVPAGSTLAFIAVCNTNVAGAATVRDTFDLTDQPFVSQGQETVSVTYTQT
jgi:hypothetical protein